MPKTAKPLLFMHEKTGDIVRTKKSRVKDLPPEYKPIKFTHNNEGEAVMRVTLTDDKGVSVTMDISEADSQEVTDVEPISK